MRPCSLTMTKEYRLWNIMGLMSSSLNVPSALKDSNLWEYWLAEHWQVLCRQSKLMTVQESNVQCMPIRWNHTFSTTSSVPYLPFLWCFCRLERDDRDIFLRDDHWIVSHLLSWLWRLWIFNDCYSLNANLLY